MFLNVSGILESKAPTTLHTRLRPLRPYAPLAKQAMISGDAPMEVFAVAAGSVELAAL